MLNNRDWRSKRLMSGMLKRARKARGRIVRDKNLGGSVKWVAYKGFYAWLYKIGVGRVSIIGRWPRTRVLDTVVHYNANSTVLLHCYERYKQKISRGNRN